jgi:hypothetical protein
MLPIENRGELRIRVMEREVLTINCWKRLARLREQEALFSVWKAVLAIRQKFGGTS